jgi:hypothetical protein
MKNYIRLGLIQGFMLISTATWPLSAQQLQAVVDTTLKGCADKAPVVPQTAAQVFSEDRIERTLNGVWRGRVSGEYDKQFLATDGYLNVDYYMIVDVAQHEALVFEQLGSKRAVAAATSNAPVWSYQMCGRDRYLPAHPAQVHEFQKVSDNVGDARALLKTSTGLTFADSSQLVLSTVWQQLVNAKYFDTGRAKAYAGALFKPFEIGPVANQAGGATLFSMKYQAEYRGAGETAAKFQRGVPIHGVEQGQFLGVTVSSGDFLVSSLGNGVEFQKVATDGGLINMFFDKVVIGPLVK